MSVQYTYCVSYCANLVRVVLSQIVHYLLLEVMTAYETCQLFTEIYNGS